MVRILLTDLLLKSCSLQFIQVMVLSQQAGGGREGGREGGVRERKGEERGRECVYCHMSTKAK